ncbi:MAG: hypothetical protein PW788_10375 [Micavibrio sp.]|nr:hypothetical protein [Micavibrio sp.]
MIFAGGIAKTHAAFLLAAMTVCSPQATPTVQMTFTNNAPVEINDKSSAELGSFHISTTFSHTRNEIFTVGGLMESNFAPEYRILFMTETDPVSGLACISPSQISIAVNYAPRIYIASEVARGTCRYTVNMQHEVRHVNTDIITFNEFLPQIGTAVQDAVNKIRPMGPTDAGGLTIAQNRITDIVQEALVRKTEEIEKIRLSRQQMIDTRAEYLRASALCQGQ